MAKLKYWVLWVLLGVLIYLCGCSSKQSSDEDSSIDSSGDRDTLPETDTDQRPEVKPDSDSETFTQGSPTDDLGTESGDTDSKTNVETGTETHADTETGTGTAMVTDAGGDSDSEGGVSDIDSETQTSTEIDTIADAGEDDDAGMSSGDADPGPCLGNSCNDGNTCNGLETCNPVDGQCIGGTALVCDDGDACNGTETCDAVSGCQNGTPVVCDDNLICNGVETCDASNGACINPPDVVCGSAGVCTEPAGICSCNAGYEGSPCVDIDECTAAFNNCAADAICTNTTGAFTCTCNPGFSGNGTSCTDIDECTTASDNCAADATCTNTTGSFTCACNPGFSGNGTSCTDIDECTAGTDNCPAESICINTTGAFTCTCDTGFSWDGASCADIDECTAGTDNCAIDATCTNTTGTFTCACQAGYSGDGTTCADVDECTAGTDNCAIDATCTNTVGTFTCACQAGYSGDGTTCADIDECTSDTDNCGSYATCTNTPGGFTCECNSSKGSAAPGTLRNIILLVADGMGFEQLKATRIYATGDATGDISPLSMEELPYSGQVTTSNISGGVTDSAAAGTAMATGHKVANAVISINTAPNPDVPYETVLEYYKALGKRTGAVTIDTDMLDATPSAFTSHAADRNSRNIIASTMMGTGGSHPNILFGQPNAALTQNAATTAGYTVVTTETALYALDPDTAEFVAGFFSNSASPNLPARTEAALDILDSDPDGFFLLIEHEGTDNGGHDHNIPKIVDSALELNDALNVVMNWANVCAADDTLIVVLADHETGGLTLNVTNPTAGTYPQGSFSTPDHTAANVPVFAWGLNADVVTGTLDNTDICALLRGDRIE